MNRSGDEEESREGYTLGRWVALVRLGKHRSTEEEVETRRRVQVAGEEEEALVVDSGRLLLRDPVEEVEDDAVVLLVLLDELGEAPTRGKRRASARPWRARAGETERRRAGGGKN
jgi:nitrogen fixation protein FixH